MFLQKVKFTKSLLGQFLSLTLNLAFYIIMPDSHAHASTSNHVQPELDHQTACKQVPGTTHLYRRCEHSME